MTPADDPRTDADLVAACNAGDLSAFEALYHRHRDWVLGLALRFTGDRDLALDVMQDTFAHLLRRFPGFELRAKLTTFLYPVVRHQAAEARRKARRMASTGDKIETGHAVAGTNDDPAAADPREELAAVMRALSEDQRETLLLRFVDGLTLEEIATAMAVPLGTVKSRLHLALRTLREDPRTREFFLE